MAVLQYLDFYTDVKEMFYVNILGLATVAK